MGEEAPRCGRGREQGITGVRQARDHGTGIAMAFTLLRRAEAGVDGIKHPIGNESNGHGSLTDRAVAARSVCPVVSVVVK